MYEISSSVPTPPILSRNSTTVTLESRQSGSTYCQFPVYDTSTTFPGTFWSESASVKLTICTSSNSTAPLGKGVTSDLEARNDAILHFHASGLAVLIELHRDGVRQHK